jgi:hypothetical protein
MNTRPRTPKQLEAFAKMNAGRTNLARARKTLTRDELFFYEHAGYSYDPKTESADEGRVRCAREMAKAEAFVKGQEYEYEWDWDESGCNGCDCDSPDCKCSTGEEHETLCVSLFNPRDRETDKYATLVSLSGICGADAKYRRVIEAELALEAMDWYDRETEVLDAH